MCCGYEKLKPHGIAINGCIEGFSRFVLWMEAYITNSDPKVIAVYYISPLTRNGYCPERMRADRGTENGLKDMQVFLRRHHMDSFDFNIIIFMLSSVTVLLQLALGSRKNKQEIDHLLAALGIFIYRC